MRISLKKLTLIAFCALPSLVWGQEGEPKTAPVQIDFARQIQPILSENCYYCHGPDAGQRQAGIRLDVEQEARDFIEAGVANDSLLFHRITSNDPDERMPPPDSNRSLTLDQIELLKRWINQGAVWGKHWAFVPLERPPLEPLGNFKGSSAIDFLVEKSLRDKGMSFAPQAAKRTLIRRVAIDLTGLPPNPKQVREYLDDRSVDAYETMVDRFLDSPAYGERMAWVWLDAARYADTNGYQADNERTMWPWRDWVIRAYNDNMPFDQFSKWQLAGDRMPDATTEQILATAFLRNHPINGEGGRIAEENRVDYVMDMAETTGTLWMGLTFNCCRCHDHKYDQLSQKDYYQLFAFFNQTPVTGAGGNPQTKPVLELPNDQQRNQRKRLIDSLIQIRNQLAARESSMNSGQADWDASELADFKKGPPAIVPKSGEVVAELRKALTTQADKRSKQQGKLIREAYLATDEIYASLSKKLESENKRLADLQKAIPKVMVMGNQKTFRKTFLLERGSYEQPREEVFAAIPAMFAGLGTAPRDRIELADWLFEPSNPLTARVAVNRIWAQVFGMGLVKTTEDFGVQSEPPSHPELLDWLAVEYRESGWDTKQLFRILLNSRTYKQSSKSTLAAIRLDPDNRALARARRIRMPAWMIRDYALAASGRLVSSVGGPSVNSYQPAGVWEESSFGKKRFVLGKGDELYRRSIYTFWRRIAPPTLFFDNADRMTCSVNPFLTNTPLHALTILNDTTFVEAARLLATKAIEEIDQPSIGGSDKDKLVDLRDTEVLDQQKLNVVYERLLVRLPNEEESRILLDALNRTRRQFAQDPESASLLIRVGESPVDPKADVVELASWTSLCLAVLNLDETLTKQ